MIRHSLSIAMLALALAGCDAPETVARQAHDGLGANGRRDLAGVAVDTSGERQGKSYARYDEQRDLHGTGLAFAGYGCESDCADTISGYRRARQEKIVDPRRCPSPGWGELEGCVAFTQGRPSELSSLPPLRESGAR